MLAAGSRTLEGVEPGADRGAALRELIHVRQRAAHACGRLGHLLRVATELLALQGSRAMGMGMDTACCVGREAASGEDTHMLSRKQACMHNVVVSRGLCNATQKHA